jgi:molybdate transport system substrate-binding protein
MTRLITGRIWLLAAVVLISSSANAAAETLRVLSSTLSQPAIAELGAIFERKTGHQLVIRFDNNPILKDAIETGAVFDVVIIEPDMLDALIMQGQVAAGSRRDLARVGMALVTAAGRAASDISTVERFRTTLLQAKSIGYVPTGFSGVVFLRTVEQLGLTAELKPKLRPTAGTCETPVAAGEIEMCAIPATIPPPGSRILGRFPEKIQTYIGVSAGLSSKPAAQSVARLFTQFLTSGEAVALFSAKGFQTVAAR